MHTNGARYSSSASIVSTMQEGGRSEEEEDSSLCGLGVLMGILWNDTCCRNGVVSDQASEVSHLPSTVSHSNGAEMKVIADLRAPGGGRRRFDFEIRDDSDLLGKVSMATLSLEDLLRDDDIFRDALLDSLKENGLSENDGSTDIQLYIHLPIKLSRLNR